MSQMCAKPDAATSIVSLECLVCCSTLRSCALVHRSVGSRSLPHGLAQACDTSLPWKYCESVGMDMMGSGGHHSPAFAALARSMLHRVWVGGAGQILHSSRELAPAAEQNSPCPLTVPSRSTRPVAQASGTLCGSSRGVEHPTQSPRLVPNARSTTREVAASHCCRLKRHGRLKRRPKRLRAKARGC